MSPEISVLIPVYNASEFLHYSIPCILNQSFSDIELICVNDGSMDDSLEILKEFADNDSRVKVIDKENGGCGSARNRALKEASGKYIYFFDPDDKLEEDTFELIHDSAVKNNSDMVIFKANIFDKDGISNNDIFFTYDSSIPEDKFDSLTFNDIKCFVLDGGFAPWSKLYKKEFLDSFDDFKFDLGLAFDDVPFHVKSMIRAGKISFVNRFLYHYNVGNVNSVNNTSSNGFDIFTIIDIIEDILKRENRFDELKSAFYKFKVSQILLYIISTDSSEYYAMARERYAQIDTKYIEDSEYLKPRYDLVMMYDDFEEFKPNFENIELEYEIDKHRKYVKNLKRENSKLRKTNKKLKKVNSEILNSNSMKITESLRKLRNL